MAGGRAFTFRYAETEELLRAAGCRPVVFDPLVDDALPAGTAGLYLGGGFPQVHAVDLTANAVLRGLVRDAIAAGTPTVAECAGLLYLCAEVDGQPMVGAVAATAAMTPRLTLGYRTAVADTDQLLGPAGRRVTGHEFHRTTADPPAAGSGAWLVDGVPDGFALDPAGTGRPTVHASLPARALGRSPRRGAGVRRRGARLRGPAPGGVGGGGGGAGAGAAEQRTRPAPPR